MITTADIAEFIGFGMGSFALGYCSTYLLLGFKKAMSLIFK